jgi:phosphonate transport system permease protein
VPTAELRRPFPAGRRGLLILGLALIGVVAWQALGLSLRGLVPSSGGVALLRRFLGAALHPALDYEAVDVPAGAEPFLLRTLGALWTTVLYAAAAMSLALVWGVVLGFLASSSWWAGDPGVARGARSAIGPVVQVGLRVLIACMRSVHELLWAIVFLAAVGLGPGTAILALAVPYAGTQAKVLTEMLDEAARDCARGVRAVGAGPVSVFLWGTLPRALPDMAAYAFYRLECAIRSSAVLGFFGFPTIGYYLKASFEDTQYREVWTQLYALIAVVLLLEAWSGALRRRFVA